MEADGVFIELIEEFLNYYELRNTLKAFETESEIFHGVNIKEWRPLNGFKRKARIMQLLNGNDKDSFFDALIELLPEGVSERTDYLRLEFDLNLYFATTSLMSTNKDERQLGMRNFREYLETRGAYVSQSTECLAYYALPYVPNPQEHPIYQQLFKESWRKSVSQRLAGFIDMFIQSNEEGTPRLVAVWIKANNKDDRVIKQLTNELADAEKRATQSQKRFSRLQSDYQTLISVTADLLDALESNLRGKPLDTSMMENIYSRLVSSQKLTNASLDVDRSYSGGLKSNQNLGTILRESVRNSVPTESLTGRSTINSSWSEKYNFPLVNLDYAKIKRDLASLDDRKKCYVLQALRWRLTKSKVPQREQCLTSFVRNDLLDLTTLGSIADLEQKRAPLLACLRSNHHRVREYTARFINALASLCRGRAYLSQTSSVVELLIEELRKESDESITRENFVGALQKMSLRRNMQTVMIQHSVIAWVTHLLETMDNLSDYTLEYAVALCMNLCLRTSGKRSCVPIAARVLKVLMNLLSSENIDIVPYVNGALYSILALPEIRKVADKMDIVKTLNNFIKPDQPEMNRQFEFIIRRLHSDEEPLNEDSDDDMDDEDDEEDPSTLETDLDRQDLPPPDPSDMNTNGSHNIIRDPRLWVGEGLLKHNYAVQTVVRGEANGGVDWCKPMLPRDSEARASVCSVRTTSSVLNRPTTPGQRSIRNSISESRPNTASKHGQITDAPSLAEQSINQLDLRDSLATITQSFSDEATPRPSSETKPAPSKSNSTDVSRHRNSKVIVINKKEQKGVFESRPKIPRTPDATSPTHFQKFNFNDTNTDDEDEESRKGAQSPDSTVSSTTTKFDKLVKRTNHREANLSDKSSPTISD